MYLSADHWLKSGRLNDIQIDFYNAGPVLFGVKEYVPALMEYVERYKARLHFSHRLTKIDGPAKKAWFTVTDADGNTSMLETSFDMIHVVPPQQAPDFIRASKLVDAAGWVDVNQDTLQHKIYPNIYALGDVTNCPNAKTAAAARKQAPVVATNVLFDLNKGKQRAAYDGYGSCPLTVERGKIVLAEFAPISLMAIMLSAGVAAGLGLRTGIVRYKAATLLATFGVLCAPLGVYVAHQLPEKVLAILFSIVLLTVSWRSFQKFQTPTLLIGDDCDDPNGCDDEEKVEPACAVNPATSKLFWTAPCTKRLILTGGFSGFLSGLLGVGGGFIIVPTLHSISNLETKMIVATSLAVIALVSMASALSYAGNGAILWGIAVPFIT
ncbi:MAG: hypothetical protein EB015_22210, partial [Methylocystaceae bacterium]|nr:hypothetical protein [Methylocystaceae bacterium]